MSFVHGVHIPDKCPEDLLFFYRIAFWIPQSCGSVAPFPRYRFRAPADRTRPGGSSTPSLLLFTRPRRCQATRAWTELGGLPRQEQIPRYETCAG